MKTIYQLSFALLTCIGLTACGANSMFEAETMAADGSVQARSAGKAGIPEGCVSWFDGCNNCMVKDGELAGCTKMACKSQTAEPKCQTFAPGFGEKAATTKVETSIEGATAPETMPETQREASAEVPANCKIWFDGCNSCVVLKGKLRGCTSKVCTAPTEPSCTKSN